jgi:hypothetical protein
MKVSGVQTHMIVWEKIRDGWLKHRCVLVLLLATLLLHSAWIAYTGYVAEDAFITFRFAQNLADGQGFTYNPEQRIYGTTTPLFTLLMALWGLLWKDPVPGAWLFNLLAALGTTFFTYQGLKKVQLSQPQRLFPLLLLILSPSLWVLDTQGMETPLVLFFMAASWSTFQRERWRWTGILLGLLLWVRIDTVLWVMIISFTTLLQNRRAGLIIVGLASATYLPWVLFALVYFGTPIPMTIVAKYWAYGVHGDVYKIQFIEPAFSILLHRLRPFIDVLKGSTPYNLASRDQAFDTIAIVLAIIFTIAGSIFALRKRKLTILVSFLILEIIRLTIIKLTFFNRYFVAANWSLCILMGYAIGTLWDLQKGRPITRILNLLLVTYFLVLGVTQGVIGTGTYRDAQHYRHEGSLQPIGQWLHKNMAEETTVQLEPLGYIGYYSGLTMLDEVGLVTPEVIHLKQQGITLSAQMLAILHPDVFVMHCDDAESISVETEWIEVGDGIVYEFLVRFDPLDYMDTENMPGGDRKLARASCYEVWARSAVKE